MVKNWETSRWLPISFVALVVFAGVNVLYSHSQQSQWRAAHKATPVLMGAEHESYTVLYNGIIGTSLHKDGIELSLGNGETILVTKSSYCRINAAYSNKPNFEQLLKTANQKVFVYCEIYTNNNQNWAAYTQMISLNGDNTIWQGTIGDFAKTFWGNPDELLGLDPDTDMAYWEEGDQLYIDRNPLSLPEKEGVIIRATLDDNQRPVLVAGETVIPGTVAADGSWEFKAEGSFP